VTLFYAYLFVSLGFALSSSANLVVVIRKLFAAEPCDKAGNFGFALSATLSFTITTLVWPIVLAHKLYLAFCSPLPPPEDK